MELIKVESSNVNRVGYEDKKLLVEFKGGGLFRYNKVPKKIYNGLMKSMSVGGYLNRHVVKGGYEYEKIDPKKFAEEQKKSTNKKKIVKKKTTKKKTTKYLGKGL